MEPGATKPQLTIAVLIKQTPDMNAARVDRAKGTVVLGSQQVISSYDEYAIEGALQLKEKHGGDTVAITAGPTAAKDVLTRALAMGIDRAIHLETTDAYSVDTLSLARALADAVRGANATLVIAGQTADDAETGQTGAQVAELLGMPLVSNVIDVELSGDSVTIRRDMEDGYQTVATTLPVMLLSSTGLTQPRFPSLKGIMAAKKKPLERTSISLESTPNVSWSEPFVPERISGGILLQDVPASEAAKQLVAWLREQKAIS